MMNTRHIYLSMVMGGMLMAACTQHDDALLTDDDSIIHVGGVDTNHMLTATAATRAVSEPVAAESLDWLKQGLVSGMDITYFTKTDEQKAQLTLQLDSDGNPATSDGKLTIYHLKAYDDNGELTDVPAKWLDNGAHTFQGVYIPKGLKTQNTTQNHDDLEHYTAVPQSTSISATVGRITIPLQHRLARVQAYVLIDDVLKTKLKGYHAGDAHDSNQTMLRFCKVQMLDYVKDGKPQWKTVSKAIPHYLGELGSIVENNQVACETFRTYKKSTGELLFPTDGEWKTAHDLYEKQGQGEASGYTMVDYGLVPSYDLIVRPTYTEATTGTNVMYDEATTSADGGNQIIFELTLENGLEYEKAFTFDLNANEETVVFLRVTPERIDYNSTGSRLWKSVDGIEKYYGVDNPDHSLSDAGSSWQRAYTNGTLTDDVSDGKQYQDNQYVSDAEFVQLLKHACVGGAHHGDYFILQHPITIDASQFGADFVFTGHLDAQDHLITLTNTTTEHNWLFAGLNGTYKTAQEDNENLPYAQWQANVHNEKGIWVPTSGWRAEMVNAIVDGGKLFKDGASITGYVNNCKDTDGKPIVEDHTPDIPEYK